MALCPVWSGHCALKVEEAGRRKEGRTSPFLVGKASPLRREGGAGGSGGELRGEGAEGGRRDEGQREEAEHRAGCWGWMFSERLQEP